MSPRAEERFKSALQMLAILGLLLIVGVVLHKAYVDVAALAEQHSGAGFWRALARYLLRNLAG